MEVCSRELEDLTLDLNEQECERSGKSRLTSTADESSQGISPMPNDSQTLGVADWKRSGELMLSLGASLARTFRSPGAVPDLMGSGRDFGLSMRESLASYDPASSSWKTSQLCLGGGWEELSETWPAWGMTRSGGLFPLLTLLPRTYGKESGLWPTPNVAGGGNRCELTPHKNHYLRPSGKKAHLGLDQAVRMWPTPAATDWKGQYKQETVDRRQQESSRGVRLPEELARRDGANGQLNPTWVEWLMGYPLGWTDLGDSETPSSRKSQSGSVVES
jgi:hypothetical protein